LGDRAAPAKALLFDKTPAANWKVSWHQDLTEDAAIALPEGMEWSTTGLF
jgi:hypothetical protein